ncbi:hypothetical protein BKA62DRAFT_775112 [Auriculariales sp. MPI-PUGE-AT-0066]|nr:hypothetical protein BKA62DRAFT_775112 [Auriculariales sp. MPI-PUGE-AT-0066]
MAQIDDIGDQSDAVPLPALPLYAVVILRQLRMAEPVVKILVRTTSAETQPATFTDAVDPQDSAPMIEDKTVELPWEETPEKRYPLPDPTKLTEHEKRYAPDRYGKELGPNARVYKIYHDRVTEKDEHLAGFFSAVRTAFLIESTKQLQPDYTEITAVAALAFLAQLQGTNSSISAPDNPPFAPTTDARWINGLWFKQWLV